MSPKSEHPDRPTDPMIPPEDLTTDPAMQAPSLEEAFSSSEKFIEFSGVNVDVDELDPATLEGLRNRVVFSEKPSDE